MITQLHSLNQLENRSRTRLELIGSYCEVMWTATNRMAKHQCQRCVYLVRGVEGGMIGIEMVYDAIEGDHQYDGIYWVPIEAIQYLHILDINAAQRRIDNLEREIAEELPKD